MEPFVQDPDFTLYVGDVRDVLRELPAESVHCVVTSPPYWGLRDYGTGSWVGGDPDCDHAKPTTTYNQGFNERWGQGAGEKKQERKSEGQYPQTCAKCGATRTDQQLGLEPTPDLYVAAMVEVFREVRRVLRADGTLWLNLGDSYAQGSKGNSGEIRPGDKQGTNAGSLATRRGAALGPNRTGGTKGFVKPKDQCLIPHRVAMALQADGWWLRSTIVWAKPNPMPESVTDRPTTSHEYVFLLSRSPRYFFDNDAVREPLDRPDLLGETRLKGVSGLNGQRGDVGRRSEYANPAGRNLRSVWQIATEPYPDAHFATFPQALVEPCVLAGTSERGCCPECGAPWERDVERPANPAGISGGEHREVNRSGGLVNGRPRDYEAERSIGSSVTLGWSPSCDHYETLYTSRDVNLPPTGPVVPCVVLDPFAGSGTVALVARKHGRHSIGIELNPTYAELAAARLSQLSLLAG